MILLHEPTIFQDTHTQTTTTTEIGNGTGSGTIQDNTHTRVHMIAVADMKTILTLIHTAITEEAHSLRVMIVTIGMTTISHTRPDLNPFPVIRAVEAIHSRATMVPNTVIIEAMDLLRETPTQGTTITGPITEMVVILISTADLHIHTTMTDHNTPRPISNMVPSHQAERRAETGTLTPLQHPGMLLGP